MGGLIAAVIPDRTRNGADIPGCKPVGNYLQARTALESSRSG